MAATEIESPVVTVVSFVMYVVSPLVAGVTSSGSEWLPL